MPAAVGVHRTAGAASVIDDGTIIGGRYRLVRRLGSGGMGVVWEAEDIPGSGRPVALKQIRLDEPDPHDRGRLAEALRREWRLAAAASDHPGVVAVHELIEHEGQPWLVMELLPGRDLRRVLATDGPLSARRAARLGVEMAEALEHLHRCGVVHGDVAPGNVMVCDDHAVITDFGISRPLQAGTVTTTHRPRGAPGFISPEVVAGQLPAESADVFGLGAVLLYAVTGRGPWGDDDQRAVFGRAAIGTPVVTARGRLRRVLGPMMRRRPRERPSLPACRTALMRVADGAGPRLWWPLLSHRRLIAAITLGLVVAAVAAGSAVWSIEQGASRTRAELAALSGDLGAQRRLDPCGLLDPGALRRFGDSSLVPDYGNYDRCDVFVDHDQHSVQITALAETDDGDPGPAGTTTSSEDGLTVLTLPAEATGCERRVALPGGADVDLTASIDSGTDPALCSMADLAVGSTVAALTGGDDPIRGGPFPEPSLGGVDACALLSDPDLLRAPVPQNSPDPVPAAGGWTHRPGFGRWSCRWEALGRGTVTIRFDRDTRGTTALGGRRETLAGRPAAEAALAPGHCEISVQQRPYPRPEGSIGYEVMILEADDANPIDPCRDARPLALAAASRLPTSP
jgi:hypothetical protein